MKRFIVTEEQLNDFVKSKQAEKIYYQILAELHKNRKNLTENISLEKTNQNVIDNFHRKGFITPKVEEMLIKRGILGENKQII